MKLFYTLLACILVTLNSAFAMLEEGPFDDMDRSFRLKREKVASLMGSTRTRVPLIIKGVEYELRGFINGSRGERFKEKSSEWVTFRNYLADRTTPCGHWGYKHLPRSADDSKGGVSLELHKMSAFDTFSLDSNHFYYLSQRMEEENATDSM